MAIRQAAQTKLDSSRLQRPAEAAKLKEWHQAYHMFRVSANAFILGVDQMCMQKYEEALDSLTVSYNISQRISERDPEVINRDWVKFCDLSNIPAK